jgi:hypothetical protein
VHILARGGPVVHGRSTGSRPAPRFRRPATTSPASSHSWSGGGGRARPG